MIGHRVKKTLYYNERRMFAYDVTFSDVLSRQFARYDPV